MMQSAKARTNLIREHLQALHIGSAATRWFRQEREPNVINVSPERVIAVLKKAGINCVLMGTHGVNVYRDEARATGDVDVLVPKKDFRKAIERLEEAFPYLEVVQNSAVARFINPVTQKSVIDVMKPSSEAMRLVFRHTVAVGKSHRIPDLEMAIVSKFLASRGPNRSRLRRSQDLLDLMNMVVTNRGSLDDEKLRRLADKATRHGGDDLTRIIRDIDAGRSIEI
jgi:hypothetical protein